MNYKLIINTFKIKKINHFCKQFPYHILACRVSQHSIAQNAKNIPLSTASNNNRILLKTKSQNKIMQKRRPNMSTTSFHAEYTDYKIIKNKNLRNTPHPNPSPPVNKRRDSIPSDHRPQNKK